MPTEHKPETRENLIINYYSQRDPEPTGQIIDGSLKGVLLSREEATFYWLEQHTKNTVLARMAAEGMIDIDNKAEREAAWEIKADPSGNTLKDTINFKVKPQDEAKLQSLLAGLSVSINE